MTGACASESSEPGEGDKWEFRQCPRRKGRQLVQHFFAFTQWSQWPLRPPLCFPFYCYKSQARSLITCLERRLPLWLSGRLMDLVNEGSALQERLPCTHRMSYKNSDNLTRSFSNLMFDGKCKAALDLTSCHTMTKGGGCIWMMR